MLCSGVALEDAYGWVAMKEHCLWRNLRADIEDGVTMLVGVSFFCNFCVTCACVGYNGG
jgi:hypothetical protein